MPGPRLKLGEALRGLDHAAIDISDGLLADLGHIVEVSELGAEVRADRLPLSDAAADLPGAEDAARSGGDDYELLFTAPPSHRDAIRRLAVKLDLRLTRIGQMQAGAGVRVLDANGQPIEPTARGWQHF
jgi:thiamine-monophosphate kinase